MAQVGSAALKGLVCIFKQLLLVRVQTQALTLVVDGLDALKELIVQGDVHGVLCLHGGNFLGYLLELIGGIGLKEVIEYGAYLAYKAARVLKGLDGVLERGGIGVVDNGVNLLLALLEGLLKGGKVVTVLNLVKLGCAVGQR